MQKEVQVPTLEQLEAVLTQLVVQRAALKDQVESIEKQMAVANAQVQLLRAQAAEAEQKVDKD